LAAVSRLWPLVLVVLVVPSTADARLRVSAPKERASGVSLPLTITGAPPSTPVAVERRTSAGWIGVKAVDSNAAGRALVRLHTPTLTRRWRLRVRAADQRSAAIGVSIRPVTLTSVGDINLGDGPGDVMAARGDRYPWTGVASRLRSADVAFGNLECAVSDRGTAQVKQYVFRGKPSRLKTLRGYAGLDVVNLANNHTGDYGKQAMADTVRYVRNAGLVGVGAGFDLAGARKPRVVERLGLKIVFVGFSDIGPYDFAAGPGTPGTRLASNENITADVRAARKLGDVVVATFHWGVERDRNPSPRQRDFARVALAAGADAIIGAHPHVLQPISRPAPHKVVAYSLGNFVWSAGSGPTAQTGLLKLNLSTRGVEGVVFTPATIVGTRPRVR
jgi:poly-gamma-glutamate synthesis protein (capsule biosynthesis protein)